MSLYAQYISERLGKHIVESNRGFATYMFIQDGVYIEDMYVDPDFRGEGECFAMADKIAAIGKEKGLKKMYGTVKPSANHSTESLKVLLAYGFKLLESGPDAIVFVKDIT